MDKEELIIKLKIISEKLRCGLIDQKTFDKEIEYLIRYKWKENKSFTKNSNYYN
ncbi:hypothetical protein [Bacillus phage KonjoTrouble]|nr:hypothetical protein MUK67_gp18 [Bacillus phage Claudi]YP_009910305.1 hypothetical protein H3013_gp18 [Bacillus phage KonjoTrouble]ANT41172.1 hypothetical protein CLAUDI_18 [Bacillus phage Claudi]ASU04141.1 hypothetical protein [Bacillus phage KonjoTrouble]QDH50300.1 hypothetical protein VIOLETTEMAD_19 [Bacillus phage VioletteMad]